MIATEILGDGPRTVALLHGLNLDRGSMKALCEPLFSQSRDYRRIYVDLPGHGASPATAPALTSADAWADALSETINGAWPDPLYVVGHGYGAYLAMALASRMAISRLALICPVVETDFAARDVPPPRRFAQDGGLEFADDLERQLFDEGALVRTPEVLERFRALVMPASRKTDRDLVALLRSRYASVGAVIAGLARVPGPSTIVCARDDHWNGYKNALRLVPVLARSAFHVLPDLGPYALVEAPEVIRAPLGAWLDG